MADRPLRPATHRSLGRPLPHQQANGPRAHPVAEAEASFPPKGTSGISPSFLGLSLSTGQITHVLLTRSRLCPRASPGSSLHLHVLSTPPAFVLSQDQTLRERPARSWKRRRHCCPAPHEAQPGSQRAVMAWCDVSYTGRRNHDGSIDAYLGRWRPGRSDLLHLGPMKDRCARMLLSFQRPPRLPGGGLPPSARPGLS